jgi:hypothetical protein
MLYNMYVYGYVHTRITGRISSARWRPWPLGGRDDKAVLAGHDALRGDARRHEPRQCLVGACRQVWVSVQARRRRDERRNSLPQIDRDNLGVQTVAFGTRLAGLSCGACVGLSCSARLPCGARVGLSCGSAPDCLTHC